MFIVSIFYLFCIRFSEGSIVKKTFTSHKEWVQCVKWSVANEFLFVSGGYDNDLKLWDTRRCVIDQCPHNNYYYGTFFIATSNARHYSFTHLFCSFSVLIHRCTICWVIKTRFCAAIGRCLTWSYPVVRTQRYVCLVRKTNKTFFSKKNHVLTRFDE